MCEASVLATTIDREGKVKAAIVDNYRSQYIDGFVVALDLWGLAIIPSSIMQALGPILIEGGRRCWKNSSYFL